MKDKAMKPTKVSSTTVFLPPSFWVTKMAALYGALHDHSLTLRKELKRILTLEFVNRSWLRF